MRAVGIGAAATVSASCSRRNDPAAGRVPPDWPALRARLAGGLVLPDEPGFDTARLSFNSLVDGRTPVAVARCTDAGDVQACVELAGASGIPVAARSGGHSYAGYCVPDGGLVVDLGRMSGVRVAEDGTAEILAGTRLIDVYATLAGAGRCLPAGSCPTVGIAGLTLGGGIGVLARKFGLTCDRLRAAKVAGAGGRMLEASEESESDLFWALRGGGGGNFGIVTSFTFATEPVPDITVFSLRYPPGAAADVLGSWQEWISGLPDEVWANCVISGGGPPAARVNGCFVGSPSVMAGLLTGLPERPTSRMVEAMDFLDAMRYFAGCAEQTTEQCRLDTEGGLLGRAGFVATSHMVPSAVPEPDNLVSLVDGRTGVDILLDSFGGAISRVPVSATAFPHRAIMASAQIYAPATTATRDRVTSMVTEVRDGLALLAGKAAYVNYIDATQPDWPTAYYGQNLSRLREVASRYDPNGVFRFAQGLAA